MGSDATGTLDTLRSIKFSSILTIAQVITTGQTFWAPAKMRVCQSAPSMNASSGTTQFGHGLYHMVRSSDWNDLTLGPRLKKLLDTSANGGGSACTVPVTSPVTGSYGCPLTSAA